MSAKKKLRRGLCSRSNTNKDSVKCPLEHKTQKAVNEYSTNNSPVHREQYKNKLRQSKIVSYSEQLDEPSSDQLNSEFISADRDISYIGSTILPNNCSELQQIIDDCNSQVRISEFLFFEEEDKDESKFSFDDYR